ncbi:NAD-dependent epimerase/dehydratase family protein [Nocardioides dongkuii]|uniref:NAD-dependent epimerase/dehydratase family protein n=1 Tax=Nocardioides dongkuii TaxID=2760089 RepID=UPI0015F837A6|nr:NAD-dependent epimerase/dehydratase family protein [Nocardioides dongkuii]
MAAPDPLTWVVGSRGLLGSAVVRELGRRGTEAHRATVPWSDEDAAVTALVAQAHALAGSGRPWQVLWCAGAGVVATAPEALEVEVRTLRRFLAGTGDLPAGARPRALVLASSAGGVHAGSSPAPFDETSEPVPISPYGQAKLQAEDEVRAHAERTGVPVVAARIANLYGPGQDLSKAQGLVTHLCRAHLLRQPLSIYVALDTARDYVFVDDVARVLLALADRAAEQPAGSATVKVVASQRSTTVAALLGELRRLTKRRPPVVLGTSPLAAYQTADLRFRSHVWTDLDGLMTTSLPAGMAATMADLRLAVAATRAAS